MPKRVRQSSLARFIQEECCCRMPGDLCVGVGFRRTKARPWPAALEGQPCPVPAGKRCGFFDVCVLPLASRMPEYQDASNQYFYAHRGGKK